MPTRTVTPLSQIDRHVPEAGRIRMGHKTTGRNGKPSMEALQHFRFTSPDRTLLEQLAAIYGGEVKPWHDDKASPKDQFQLYSNSERVNVLLIPDSLSMWYELWTGGGCKRRCDGVTCTVPEKTSDYDYELVEQPCLCAAEGKLSCKRATRIQFVLPEISFAGAWRLESKGQYASEELPGMVALIEAVTVQGRMVQAVLSIDRREKMTEVGKRNFVVPKLSILNTPLELASGSSTLAIGGTAVQPPTMQLGSGHAPPAPSPSPDDEITDAEVLTDEQLDIEQRIKADALAFGFDEHAYLAAVRSQVNGDWERMADCSRKVRSESLEPTALSGGRIVWKSLTKT